MTLRNLINDLCLSLPLFGCARGAPASSLRHSIYSNLFRLQDGSSARASSWDRTGKNIDYVTLAPGQTLEMARIEGAGCINHVYFTGFAAPHLGNLRNCVLRMFWDGEKSPSVEVPVGDFFGMGFECWRFFQSLMVTVNPGGGGYDGSPALNCYFPMPFAKQAVVTMTNEGDATTGALWYHIDYERFQTLEGGIGRFHAQWRREKETVPVGDQPNVCDHEGENLDGKENYVILEAEGKGNLAGYFLNVDNIAGGWFGEGDDMIFIDGETWPPSIHGTGTEEIFGGGACPDTEYTGPYTGFHLISNRDWEGKNSMYRFFVTDPVRFQKSIRVTIEHGHANNFCNDYSSTAFWYQNEPHAPFPALPSAAERRPR